MYRVENQSWQQATGTLESEYIRQPFSFREEKDLEQKAELLITRCYQILSEMKDKRDRMKLA